MSEKDYEHWPCEIEMDSDGEAVAAAPGYDNYNGMRSHCYRAVEPPKAPPTVVQQPIAQPQIVYGYAPQQAQYPYTPYPYAFPTQYVYPATACYGYSGYARTVMQPTEPKPPQAEAKPEKRKVLKWQGRTKAEVDEDNMKMAAREGAYNKRSMEPIGLKPDQLIWCVEIDGNHTLRTYATIQSLKGEWKPDPRFEDAWFFVRKE